ncbi:MAG: response regulator [Clostridiales bacterium]|jgi:PAS domain S-box-containing protein|nr:response regulator [Clostridiales bacterium]
MNKSRIATLSRRIHILLFAGALLLIAAVLFFFDRIFLDNALNHLPFTVVLLVTLIAFSTASHFFIRHFILKPLDKLSQSTGSLSDRSAVFFGGERNDEIGDLSRSIQKMHTELGVFEADFETMAFERERQEHLFHTVTNMASVMLAVIDEEYFDATLQNGMQMMASCVDVDRINIWKNEQREDGLYFVLAHSWFSEFGSGSKAPELGMAVSYARELPRWLEKFKAGEIISAPVPDFPENERNFLINFDVASIILIPIHLQDQFWGFVTFTDCREARAFTDDDINILFAGSLMMINTINRNEQSARVRESHERAKLMLDAMPLGTTLWNKEGKMFDCNEEVTKIFEMKDKQEFMDRFFEIMPERQPDGALSEEAAYRHIMTAFETGHEVVEWAHTKLDGTPVPMEITLVRVRYGEEFVIVCYMRDLREHRKMTQHIQATTAKLEAVISNYSGIIWSVDPDNVISLFNGLYLDELNIIPSEVEGRKLDEIPRVSWNKNIREYVRKTFEEGPQVWITDINQNLFRAHTTPVYDRFGKISGVVGSFNDITEMVRLQDELTSALTEAQAASLAKGNFLSNMSHEMRTPMNAIIGMTLIGKSAADLDKKDYAFEKIDSASQHLLGVINDILDMSKIEAGKFELSVNEFNFEKIVQDAVNVISFRVEEKKQALHISLDAHIPRALMGDDHRLTQVITNLLTNAVKFTPEEGSLWLTAKLLSDEPDGSCTIQVDVRDTGIGISEDQMMRLFTSFEQAESTTSRKYGGTGLGLAISKRIVELMGGKIWIESELGKGAQFSFVVRCSVARGKLAEANGNGSAYSLDELESFKGYCLLLAEDVEINREIVISLLESTALEIVCAVNGLETLEKFKKEPERFDMIFMDVQMPEMDGLEATRRIRAIGSKKARNIPIVAMTANVFKEDIETCISAGMNSHLGKPLDLIDMMKTLKSFLKGS